ncbi:MAG: hypothetical protein F6J93_21965 [Oscillatoria sp. SIO1A7]|nr:hypothetical protein [Oscillatoria sp. SIO1A7]
MEIIDNAILIATLIIDLLVALIALIKITLNHKKAIDRDVKQEKAIVEIQLFLLKQGFKPDELFK